MALKIALAGNPNSGKTTLFNELTGSTAHVGNWPGVTVEKKEGRYKKGTVEINVVDLPGIYSLSPYTPEEIISRNFLLQENPDVIINIVDGTNLERNLYLTTQLQELNYPVVVALNMIDQVEQNGTKIDFEALSQALGMPVVPISALRGKGIAELMKQVEKSSENKRSGNSILLDSVLQENINTAAKELDDANISHSLFQAIRALEEDHLTMENLQPTVENHLPSSLKSNLKRLALKAKEQSEYGDVEAMTADIRYSYITEHFTPLIQKPLNESLLSRSDRIDKVLTNRILGIPIFLVFMFLVFHLTFGEFLIPAKLSETLSLSEGIAEIPGPGVYVQGLTETLIDWIGGGIEILLENTGASDIITGLVMTGIVGGVGAVLSFIPQILLMFLFLSIMEDSGYMARAAFIMDRALRRFGLSGKSFVPLLMGFGCSVPAFMATRTLETEKDRRLTMMLTPFMSCGAKAPIYAAIGGVIFAKNNSVVTFGIYLLGISVAIVAGIILKLTVFKGDAAPFIMELPAYHSPRLKNLLLHLWDKLKGYVIRAGTVIMASGIVIWFLSEFGFVDGKFGMVDANSAESVLGVIGNFIKPFFAPMGFASGPDGWKAVIAILTGLIAKEAVVSTLGVLYGAEGDALEDESASSILGAGLIANFSPASALAFMAFNLLSIPCMAAVGAIKGELKSAKWLTFTLVFWVATAWIVSTLVYQIGNLFL